MIWQSYRYNANGDFTFGKPQYNNVYGYNAESYNPNMESQYLRARYYNVTHANFLTEDSYLGNINDPLTLNRYNYAKSSPLNYTDPSGYAAQIVVGAVAGFLYGGVGSIITQKLSGDIDWPTVIIDALSGAVGGALSTVVGPKIGDAIGDSIANGASYIRQRLKNNQPINIAVAIEKMVSGAAFSLIGESTGLTTLVSGIDGFMESILNGEDISSFVKNAAMSGMSGFLFSKMAKSLSKGLQKLNGLFEFGTCGTEKVGITSAEMDASLKQVENVDSSKVNKGVKNKGSSVDENFINKLDDEIDSGAIIRKNQMVGAEWENYVEAKYFKSVTEYQTQERFLVTGKNNTKVEAKPDFTIYDSNYNLVGIGDAKSGANIGYDNQAAGFLDLAKKNNIKKIYYYVPDKNAVKISSEFLNQAQKEGISLVLKEVH